MSASSSGRFTAVAWWAGAVVSGIALVGALNTLFPAARRLDRVDGLGLAGSSLVVGAAYVAVVAVVLAALHLIARRDARIALAAALGLFVLVRVATVNFLDAPLVSDWLSYHRLASGWLQGAPPIADRPMGYPILLAEAYRLGGVSVATGEWLNVVLGVAGALLLAGWVALIGGPGVAALAVAILALTPSQALFGVVLGSETAYCTALLAVVLVSTHAVVALRDNRPRRAIALGVGAGLLLGLSMYVRTTSLLLVPVLALLPFAATGNIRPGIRVGIAVVVGFLVATAPVIGWNQAVFDRPSPSTSLYGGWQLYIGANRETGGRWNQADGQRVQAAAPRFPVTPIPVEYEHGIFDPESLRAAAIRDETAMALAVERIRAGGIALLGLLPEKIDIAWSSAASGASWVFDAETSERELRLAAYVSQLGWVLSLAGALVWYVLERHRRPLAGLLVSAIVVPLALALLVLEVQPRYHEYAVPLLVALAGLAAARVPTLRKRAEPVSPGTDAGPVVAPDASPVVAPDAAVSSSPPLVRP